MNEFSFPHFQVVRFCTRQMLQCQFSRGSWTVAELNVKSPERNVFVIGHCIFLASASQRPWFDSWWFFFVRGDLQEQISALGFFAALDAFLAVFFFALFFFLILTGRHWQCYCCDWLKSANSQIYLCGSWRQVGVRRASFTSSSRMCGWAFFVWNVWKNTLLLDFCRWASLRRTEAWVVVYKNLLFNVSVCQFYTSFPGTPYIHCMPQSVKPVDLSLGQKLVSFQFRERFCPYSFSARSK